MDFPITLAQLLTITTMYAVVATAIWVAGKTIIRWRWLLEVKPIYALLYWVIILFALYSTVIRTFIYEAGKESAPFWYPRVIDGFWVLVCVLMAAALWEKDKP